MNGQYMAFVMRPNTLSLGLGLFQKPAKELWVVCWIIAPNGRRRDTRGMEHVVIPT